MYSPHKQVSLAINPLALGRVYGVYGDAVVLPKVGVVVC